MLISRGMTPHSGVWHLSVTHCNFRDRVRLGVDDGCCGNSDVSEEDLSTWGPIRPAINTAADLTIKTRLPDLRPPTHQLYWQISIPCHYPCCDLQTLQHLAPDGGRAGPDLTTSWVSAINYKHKHLDQVFSQVFFLHKEKAESFVQKLVVKRGPEECIYRQSFNCDFDPKLYKKSKQLRASD
jgi:Iap family predicted aminopeptidase